MKAVSRLQNRIDNIGSGNFDYSIENESNDEIGQLFLSVDNMASRLKEMTRTLQEQERMAAIGQTAGMVGHDLRNPLQTIIGEVYLAKTELQSMPPSEAKDSL